MRICYVGELEDGRTAYHRMNALRDLGHQVIGLNVMHPNTSVVTHILNSFCHKIGYPRDIWNINKNLLSHVKQESPDIIWLDKVLSIQPKTLNQIKKIKPDCFIVFYSVDDMMNPINQSKYYLSSIKLFDLHVTTKSYNVEELKGLGCRNVILTGNGYDPETHHPLNLTAEERRFWAADVGFVGGYEIQRYNAMSELGNKGMQIRIIGSFWPDKESNPNIRIAHGDIVGLDYARAINATKINLCFLRKVNRDLQTTRSIEIPACGGFMLAERTDEHLELFQEGEEAEFFNSIEEIYEKVKFYLTHDEKREKIAAAGLNRCIQNGYSNKDRLEPVIKIILETKRDAGLGN